MQNDSHCLGRWVSATYHIEWAKAICPYLILLWTNSEVSQCGPSALLEWTRKWLAMRKRKRNA